MFVGHFGAGLLFKRADREVNLGIYFLASMLPDIILWILVLLGLESIGVPANYTVKQYHVFTFPYSHGLTADIFWSLLFGTFVWKKLAWDHLDAYKAGLAVGAAVFSHFILDFLVHIPEMPLLGNASPKIGLGLWNYMYLALAIELGITVVGLIVYMRGTKRKLIKRIAILLAFIMLAWLTIVEHTMTPKPATPEALAVTGLFFTFIVSLIGFWVDGSFSLTAEN